MTDKPEKTRDEQLSALEREIVELAENYARSNARVETLKAELKDAEYRREQDRSKHHRTVESLRRLAQLPSEGTKS